MHGIRRWMGLLEQASWPDEISADDLLQWLRQTGPDLDSGDLAAEIIKFTRYLLWHLPVESLRCAWSPRNPENIPAYATRMSRGEIAPPIIYDMVANQMIDGCHRAAAAKLAGIPSLAAYVGIEANLDPDWDY